MNAIEHDVRAAAPVADRPFDIVMGIWARWMRLKDQQNSSGGAAADQDTKEFMALGEAVMTMVDDLPRVQWWAVLRSRGICTVWRFPEASFPDALSMAEEIMTPKMLKNAATRRYFA
jgi:hypothetical protein